MTKKIIALILVCFIIGVYPSFLPPRVLHGTGALVTRMSSTEASNGHTLLLEITPQDSVALRYITAVRGDTTTLRLYDHPKKQDGSSFALIGISYFASHGPDTIHVGWTEDDIAYGRALPFTIVEGPYRSEQIRGVPQSRVTPSAADYRRIARERKKIAEAYVSVLDSVLMDGAFRMPVEKVTITSEYGTRRVFNKQLRSYHSGLDLRAYEGTPLYAAQSGLVKLAMNLFYSGNYVLIEHGMGVYSSYSHMSKTHVKKGEWVEKGQRLGLSGSTGRVNAAHLHWTINIGNVRVSPQQFFDVLASLYRTEGASEHER